LRINSPNEVSCNNSGVIIFAVPDGRVKILSQGNAVKNYYGGNGFEHEKENYPELR
jgi:hypothetical protein